MHPIWQNTKHKAFQQKKSKSIIAISYFDCNKLGVSSICFDILHIYVTSPRLTEQVADLNNDE